MNGNLKELKCNDMLHFKMTIKNVKTYKKSQLKVFRHNIMSNNLNDIEKIYYFTKNNKVICIKFKNDKVLHSFYVLELDLI